MLNAPPHIKWTARLTHWSAQLLPRTRIVGGLTQGLMSAAAAIIAYLPAKPLGLREGFWGSITAIAVVQTEFSATRTSARDQFTGAAIGGLVSALVVAVVGTSGGGQHLPTYAAAVVLSMLACWLCNVSSAARLSGSTATIVVLVPHQGGAAHMLVSRVVEVGWGVTVGIAIVWLVNFAERRLRGGNSSVLPPG